MNYEPLLERDERGIREALRDVRRDHTSEELFRRVARFAVLAYSPSQHSKHAMIACLSAWEVRDRLGGRFDDLLAECAIYAAASRQPWSEPPLTDPPAIDDDQPGDLDSLRASDRLAAERWLAKRYRDPDFARDLFTVACDDFEDLGHKLIVAVTAWKLAAIFGEQGSYATLRTAIWEIGAYGGPRYEERGRLADERAVTGAMVAADGDVVAAHAVFLLDAALQTGDDRIVRRVRDYLGSNGAPAEAREPVFRTDELPVYRLARDYGAYLKSWAVAERLGDPRIAGAAKFNLDHAPSFEDFTLA